MLVAGPLERARYQARVYARQLVLGAIGGIFILAGLVFVAMALWITLADLYGTRATAVIAGAVCIGIGLIALALSSRPPRILRTDARGGITNMASPGPAALTASALVEAFIIGIRAGRSGRRRRRGPRPRR